MKNSLKMKTNLEKVNGNRKRTRSKMCKTRNRFKTEYEKIEYFILIVIMIARNYENGTF